jgi:4-hydroxyphenylacetate 3-hydroxylase, reductase component
MDSRAFRDALGCFPTGVAVVTAAPMAESGRVEKQTGTHFGITVNSFTAVSLDPPLLLWCLDRLSRRHEIFIRAERFTVSVLGTEHKPVSSRLARPGEHALDGIALIETRSGPPALADSLAVFECATEKRIEAGDHTIILGRVLAFSRPSHSAPLIYFRGKYSALDQNG